MPIFGNIYDAQKIENGEPVAEDEKMAEPGETRRVREPVVDEKGVDDYEDVRIGKPQVVAADIVVESDEDRNNRNQDDTQDDPWPRRRAEKANGREREGSRNRAGRREAGELGHLRLVR